MSKRTVACLAISIAVACQIGADRVIVDSDHVAMVFGVATTTSGETAFVGSDVGFGTLAEVDYLTGDVRGSVSAPSPLIALAPDGQDDDGAWSLHSYGQIINWAEGLVIQEELSAPLQWPWAWWAWPTPCDIGHASDGDLYYTSLQAGSSWLWRRDGSTQTWDNPVNVGSDAHCPRVAYDLLSDDLYVLLDDQSTLVHLDPDTLGELSSVDLEINPNQEDIVDVDVQMSVLVAVGHNYGWVYNPASGEQLSEKYIGGGTPSSVQMTGHVSLPTPEMVVATGGFNSVRAFQLLDH